MNSYLKIRWIHKFPEDPVVIYSEIDSERMELRKVEEFLNGKIGYASFDLSNAYSFLSEKPLPTIGEISKDKQFIAEQISSTDFEKIWKTAVARGSTPV